MKKILWLCMIAALFASCQSSGGGKVKADKLCALTFDDGPDAVKTPLVLDKLEKYKIPATFFHIGSKYNEDLKPVIARILKDKCEIGNHSWSYSSMNAMTADQIKESISQTQAVIKEYTGKEPKFFRPPNLAMGGAMAEAIDLPWAGGILGMDWAGTNTDAQARATNVLNGMRDGAIILLHDVQPDPHPTPEALDILIPELIKQGYEFVTLSDLFKRKGIDPMSMPDTLWGVVEK
jgi:peptidoglycan/xylan/chitin deacetylase (PgdA/CDA1 family)